MQIVRARLDKGVSVARRRLGGTWERVEPRSDWDQVDATSEADISRQIAEDEAEEVKAAAAWARRVRRRAALSQIEFARRIGVPLATVQGWERGKHRPDGTAHALLRVIEHMPEAALAALASASR